MYAKIYEAIFDSSIAEDYQVRHVFEDLLKLADQDGTVNRTHESIARRANVPLEIVKRAISELEKPDPRSQSRESEGRRLVRLDESRDWGWKIVNHGYYRSLRTSDEKREQDKLRQRQNRKQQELISEKATDCDNKLQNVTSAYAYASASEPEGMQGEGKIWTPNAEQLRFNALFGRRQSTKWSGKEIKAWKAVTPISEDDFEALERFYFARHPVDKDYRKRKLITLLNDFNGSVDQARNYRESTIV